MSPKGREIRVGLVILAALAVLAVGDLRASARRTTSFRAKNHYYIELQLGERASSAAIPCSSTASTWGRSRR